ncbi:MAG: hypothetical protein ACRCTQ_04600 [Brevinemataceae bacterium]
MKKWERHFDDFVFGDLKYQHVKSQKIIEWEDHVFQLLENDFANEVLKLGIFDPIEFSEKTVKDTVLFILITLYLEIPYTFKMFDLSNNTKKFYKKVKGIRTEIVKELNHVNRHIHKFRITMRDLYQKLQQLKFPEVRERVDNLIDNFLESSKEITDLLDNDIAIVYNIGDSLSYFRLQFQTRKLHSKTGIRDLALKYITLSLQICCSTLPKSYKKIVY